MTARLALEDAQFARGVRRADAASERLGRRMEGTFGRVGRRLVGQAAAYIGVTRAISLYARAAEEGRQANDALQREFDDMRRASSKAWDEFRSDAAEGVNVVKGLVGSLHLNVVQPILEAMFGREEIRGQYEARRIQREQTMRARATEEDRRTRAEVEEEIARHQNRRFDADRVEETERHRRRRQEIEEVRRSDRERADRLLDMERQRHEAALEGIRREEDEEARKGHKLMTGSADVGLGRSTRAAARGPGQGTAGPRSNEEVVRRFREFKEGQAKMNDYLKRIAQNTAKSPGAVYGN